MRLGGVATFANLSINATGNGYTLAASATGLTGATSNSFNLPAVIITAQPLSQTVVAGETATFSVAASGSGLSYQWLENGMGIPGAKSKTYTTAATTVGNSGEQFSVIVSDAFGNLPSSTATLTVLQPVSPATYYVDFAFRFGREQRSLKGFAMAIRTRHVSAVRLTAAQLR